MPIKNFRKDRLCRVKPIVDVKIGANVPTICQEFAIYAESEGNRCVSPTAGECKHIKTCRAARRDGKMLESAKIKTRPCQLGFFLIPEKFRVQMGLPPRPTEIPGIIFISHEIQTHCDSSGRVVGIWEPESVIDEYPICDYSLQWWSATNLICRGDGERAVQYPADTSHEKHMRERKCLYKECPDYKKEKQCREVGELFFRVQNSPGFPAMWRFSTRSPKAIGYLLDELREIYAAIGHVSMVPCVLSCEKEKASPHIKKTDRETGEITKTKISIDVYRVHVRTEFTMHGALAAKREAIAFIAAAGPESDIKVLQAATPETRPDPEPPVEQLATAPPEEWNSEPEQESTQESPTQAAEPEPYPDLRKTLLPPRTRANQSKPTPAATKQPDPPEPSTKPENAGNSESDAQDAAATTEPDTFESLEDRMIRAIINARDIPALKAVASAYYDRFREIGFEPSNTDTRFKNIIEAYRAGIKFIKNHGGRES